jgi:predicted MPP superfamily phosphohydrolase
MHTHEKNIRFTQPESTQGKHGLRLVCMSDLHHITHDFPVPDGDVLIIAGDVCGYGTRKELEIFDDFLSRQGHAYKLLIAGNHDWPYARLPLEEAKGLVKNATYLQDDGIEIGGLKFWGVRGNRGF